MQGQLIALDWGTTSLRAYRLGEQGRVLEHRSLSAGIMQLPSKPRWIAGQLCADGFELAFDDACGDWLDAEPTLPVIACGMVGSAQGWREAVYQETPANAAALGSALVTVCSVRGVNVHIIPGLLQRAELPDVMRGEETQVLGVLCSQIAGETSGPLLIGLPGSHSKWVTAVDDRIVHLRTFMTGEVYASLSCHSILGRTMQPSDVFQTEAFDRGVAVSQSASGAGGLLSTIFSCRTLGLTGALAANAQPDYLSGLLIGHEIFALTQLLLQQATELPAVVLAGSGPLLERYLRALVANGFSQVTLAEQATERGLWQVAVQAGLVSSTCAAAARPLPIEN